MEQTWQSLCWKSRKPHTLCGTLALSCTKQGWYLNKGVHTQSVWDLENRDILQESSVNINHAIQKRALTRMATSHIAVAPNSIITLPSSFITMVGTFYNLPFNVRCTIPQQILDSQLRRCPVVSWGCNQHILFSPDGLFLHRLQQVALDGADHEEDAWVGYD